MTASVTAVQAFYACVVMQSELIPAEQGRDKYHFHYGKCNPRRDSANLIQVSSIKC
jgi:hypothetical protein